MDVFTSAKRSSVMSSIRSKNTKPEIILRKSLHAVGMRFRLHRKELPGCPDIVFPVQRVAIQVRGCFWHQHSCNDGRKPKSNQTYWNDKLNKNVDRDAANDAALRNMGWTAIVVWECELSSETKARSVAAYVKSTVRGSRPAAGASASSSSSDLVNLSVSRSNGTIKSLAPEGKTKGPR